MLDILLFPLLICLSLVFIHVLFGSIVLKRGIIFIDIALAQWAALGYIIGHYTGSTHQLVLFGWGFGFTLIAATLLTLIKPLFTNLNYQEASIGILYISATALATTFITATGMEGYHLKEMFSGHLLFVTPIEILSATLLYGLVGLCLYLGGFTKATKSTSKKQDFLFYILFGLVVTSSVKLVGILLVFSFLIIPLMCIKLLLGNTKHQVLYGWVVGLLSCILGLGASLLLDIPPSFCIILILCLIWILALIQKLAITPKSA